VRQSPAGKNEGTEADDNVGIRNQVRASEDSKLRRLYVCCTYSDVWSAKLSGTVVVICIYDLWESSRSDY
jgi:hypothetical protein